MYGTRQRIQASLYKLVWLYGYYDWWPLHSRALWGALWYIFHVICVGDKRGIYSYASGSTETRPPVFPGCMAWVLIGSGDSSCHSLESCKVRDLWGSTVIAHLCGMVYVSAIATGKGRARKKEIKPTPLKGVLCNWLSSINGWAMFHGPTDFKDSTFKSCLPQEPHQLGPCLNLDFYWLCHVPQMDIIQVSTVTKFELFINHLRKVWACPALMIYGFHV